MMLGSPASFGIQYELDPNSGGVWMFGRCCYWIGGAMVGRYDLPTSLRDVFTCLHAIVKDDGDRANARLSALPADGLFRTLRSRLYGDDPEENPDLIVECPARFEICPSTENFDGVSVFAISDGMRSRIVFNTTADGSIREEFVSRVALETTLRKFFEELDLLYHAASTVSP